LTALLRRYKYHLKRPGQPDDGTEKTASFGYYSAGPVDPADLTKADFDTTPLGNVTRRLASALPLAARCRKPGSQARPERHPADQKAADRQGVTPGVKDTATRPGLSNDICLGPLIAGPKTHLFSA
jgi:hypothetical protein